MLQSNQAKQVLSYYMYRILETLNIERKTVVISG